MHRVLLSIFIIAMSIVPFNVNAGVIQDSFIEQGHGAQISAMGETAAALCGNPEYIFFNPAANAYIEKLLFSSSYGSYFGGTFSQGSFSGAIPVKGLGVFSVAIPAMMVSDIPHTAINGTGEFEQVSSFQEIRIAGIAGWAYAVNNIAIGANVKYIRQKLAQSTAAGLGFDLGIQYRKDIKWAVFSMGYSLTDVGNTELLWSTGQKDYLPARTMLGFALTSETDCGALTLAYDIVCKEGINYMAGGIEYKLCGVALRAGTNNKAGTSSLYYGVGIDLKGFCIDYSYRNNEDLGNTSKMSIGFSI